MLRRLKNWYHFLHPRFQSLFLEYRTNFEPRFGHGKPAHPELLQIIENHREIYKENLEKTKKYHTRLQQLCKSSAQTNPDLPAWNNGFLPGLDILMLYSLLAERKPRYYIEVGSGNSTKVAALAVREHSPQTEIISIDPYPRAEIDRLATQIFRQPFEQIDVHFLECLGENDILFIDNSHRVLPNSDATVFFLEVLPRLKKGVIVHIHDIYLPYDYPQFMCDRFYSEQYLLAAFILANPQKYMPLMPNYFVSEDKALSNIIADFWKHAHLEGVERHGGSFWLQIKK